MNPAIPKRNRFPRPIVLCTIAACLFAGAIVLSPRLSLAEPLADEPPISNTEISSDIWSSTLTGGRNETTATLSVPGAADLLSQGVADTVLVNATMSYNGKITRSVERRVALSELTKDNLVIDLGDFGKFEAKVSYELDGTVVHEEDPLTVGVTADSYTIAPISATLPTTFFSLNLWGESSVRTDGPAIIMMERPNAYSWDSLPKPGNGLYGTYALPYLTLEDVTYQPGSAEAASALFRERLDAMTEYVRDLVELDSTSHFSLYCIDLYVGIVQRIIYANNIPEGNYSVTLMSDGSWSYGAFSKVYDGADPSAQQDELITEWEEAKAYAYKHESVREDFLDWGEASAYFWAAVESEPGSEWWVARKDLLSTPNDGNSFGLAAQANTQIVQVNIANLLTENIQPSERATAEFKALYNFNDSYFSEAKANGKEVMLFLGSRVTSELAFSDYARFTMSYYGDSYQYYYKGHPGTPTELYPSKQAELTNLGITDVDSSIAAELILFFNPDIYLSGYGSSTYASVPEGMAKGMFNMTEAEGISSPEYSNMDYWSSAITDQSPEGLLAYCPSGHSCYLVEFSEELSAKMNYDVAIWDATSSLITYLDEANGMHIKVGEQQGVTEREFVAEGDYYISSALDQSKVLDVAEGSPNDGTRIQLYSFNGSEAQKWHVGYDENGLATITNLGSGKALDVPEGAAVSGAALWQYTPNGTTAQLWDISSNPGGTYTFRSALSENAVIDIAGGIASDAATVQIYDANSTSAQSFTLLPVDPGISAEGQADIKEGYYTLSTALDLGKALDVRGWSVESGSALQIWESTDKENQAFKIYRLPDGFYRIENSWSGLVLDMTAGSPIPGTRIQQYAPIDGNLNQEWAITEQTGGSYTIRNVATGLLLDVSGGTPTDGQDVIGYTANGTEAQRWLLSKALEPGATLNSLALENASVVADGTYIIRSAIESHHVLDVASGSTEDGANVQLYEDNGTGAQRWEVSHDEKGYLTLTNLTSGKMLDVVAGSKRSGTNVQQHQPNASLAQKWVAVPREDGSFELISALSPSVCLDVSGGNVSNGANIQIYLRNGSTAQGFIFESAS